MVSLPQLPQAVLKQVFSPPKRTWRTVLYGSCLELTWKAVSFIADHLPRMHEIRSRHYKMMRHFRTAFPVRYINRSISAVRRVYVLSCLAPPHFIPVKCNFVGNFSANGTRVEIRKLVISFAPRFHWTYGNMPVRSTGVIKHHLHQKCQN